MYSIKLSSKEEPKQDEFDIEYSLEDLFPEEELAVISTENIKIETHSAYNEAEKFISDLENENSELTETVQNKLSEMNGAIESSNSSKISIITDEEIKKNSINDNDNKEIIVKDSNNPNSTNSYRLVDRKALNFPNPVYICEGFGKVVLHIEVNHLGKVIHTSINNSSSTTSNLCLIESAIKYAKKARFTTAAHKPVQMGSITYIFPGQK